MKGPHGTDGATRYREASGGSARSGRSGDVSGGRELRDLESVHGYVRRICFKTGPPGRVGAELEWIVADLHDPQALVPMRDVVALLAAASPPPAGSRVTTEPGGQVELSSLPAASAAQCHRGLARDVAHLRALLEAHGYGFLPWAIDPARPPVRQLRAPRYDAMDAYFAGLPHGLGRVMMNSTAAVQVNLDAGADRAELRRRWRLLHTLGPTLVAAFANSPRHNHGLTGWKSTRQAVWLHLEPSRTHAPTGDDPVSAWARYALDAPVMMLRREHGPWVAAPGFTFRDWVLGRAAGMPPPTEGDLAYHLTTLFPPVRARGWFEVRYIDAQDPRWWPVPVAVLAALLADTRASASASRACEPVADAWLEAARDGLSHPDLARAAREVFAVAARAVQHPRLRGLVVRFARRYVEQARCPADDDVGPVTADPPWSFPDAVDTPVASVRRSHAVR